jgi:hypothetical protein
MTCDPDGNFATNSLDVFLSKCAILVPKWVVLPSLLSFRARPMCPQQLRKARHEGVGIVNLRRQCDHVPAPSQTIGRESQASDGASCEVRRQDPPRQDRNASTSLDQRYCRLGQGYGAHLLWPHACRYENAEQVAFLRRVVDEDVLLTKILRTQELLTGQRMLRSEGHHQLIAVRPLFTPTFIR